MPRVILRESKMPSIRAFAVLFLAIPSAAAATFGTVVPHPSALADLALDEARSRLYVVNTGANAVEVYSTASSPPRLVYTIPTDAQPSAAAMSRAGNSLYVACYGAASLDVIDLTSTAFNTSKIALSASPQAVAVGFNEKVLISTIGTGNGQDVLITYDPTAAATAALQAISPAPPAPSAPTLSPSNMVESVHAHLQASADGKTIVGVHELANNTRTVFVFDVNSATVLGARNLSALSPVLAVSADGSQFLSGPVLLESASLLVLAQQSTTNAPFVFPSTANFNTQATQGGAVYAQTPLGPALLTAYNIVPQLSPAPASNTSELLLNAPANLLIQLGIMLPETLAGKMVITANSATAYAISQSGFMVLPLGTLLQQPIAMPDSNVALLAYDPCGVTAAQNSAVIPVRNIGGGRISTLSAQVLASSSTSAQVKTAAQSYGANLTVSFNSAAARTPGTSPPDQLLLQANEIINIVPNVRVFQNNRNPESPGAIVPIDIGATATGLTDMVQDTTRQRLYLANPGLNRVEIYDEVQQQLLSPIPVGQLPRSLALGTDGNTLYVANSGSETISIVDLTQGAVTGRAQLPPIAFNSTAAVLTPEIIAVTERGLQVLMSDGSLWKLAGSTLEPRTLSVAVFGTAKTVTGPQSMAATSDGTYLLLLAGNGTGYLYQATVDDFVSARTVITASPITGYYGAIGAGPGGQYYLADDQVLNAALTPTSSTSGGRRARPVAAVAPVSAQTFARFSSPSRASTATVPTDAGLVEIVDASSLRTTASAYSLEGPLTAAIGTARVNVNGRTMAVNSSAGDAYLLTASGLTRGSAGRRLGAGARREQGRGGEQCQPGLRDRSRRAGVHPRQ